MSCGSCRITTRACVCAAIASNRSIDASVAARSTLTAGKVEAVRAIGDGVAQAGFPRQDALRVTDQETRHRHRARLAVQRAAVVEPAHVARIDAAAIEYVRADAG